MNSSTPGSLTIIICLILGWGIASSGCIGGERFAATDILVSKFDSSGNSVWSTRIDTGKQDYATAIIDTSDNGYALAGWIADDPRAPVHPRIIRLNETGGIVWDRILDSTSDRAISISEAHDSGFIVALDSGKVCKVDGNGIPVWNRTFNYTIHSLIQTSDGGYALTGSHTIGIDGNGTLAWDHPYTSTSILQSADNGFFVERSGVPYTYGTLFRLDANGTWIWTQPVGSREWGKITSMRETPEGTIEVVYTYPDRSKDKDLIQYMESEEITFEKDGNTTDKIPLVAVDPLTRTSDGGYAFVAYPFPGSAAFTSFPQAYSNLHLVRLTPQRGIAWDRSLDLGKWKAPQSIVQTRDRGFVTLAVLGS